MSSIPRWARWATTTAALAIAAPLVPPGAPTPAGADAPAATALTPAQLAGQRVIYSYRGPNPPKGLLDRIAAGEAAGVIFFADNITGPDQIRDVTRRLAEAAERGPVKAPPLLLTDQEGGQVRRLPGAPELSQKQIGESADPVAAATDAGTGAGDNLRGVGMNGNLAPVLDVFREPGDFADKDGRSYGNTPALAGDLGKAFVTAQQQTGVAATVKHFPGLGSASAGQNTDTQPVTLDVSLSDLRSVDEAPYESAIAGGAKMVMTSWAVYPALDPDHPAGLSPKVVREELRGRLGFTGVTVTDSLGAGALRDAGTPAQRAVAAASAGMDLLLAASRDVNQGVATAAGLLDALRGGRLSQPDFTASAQRVLNLRGSLR